MTDSTDTAISDTKPTLAELHQKVVVARTELLAAETAATERLYDLLERIYEFWTTGLSNWDAYSEIVFRDGKVTVQKEKEKSSLAAVKMVWGSDNTGAHRYARILDQFHADGVTTAAFKEKLKENGIEGWLKAIRPVVEATPAYDVTKEAAFARGHLKPKASVEGVHGRPGFNVALIDIQEGRANLIEVLDDWSSEKATKIAARIAKEEAHDNPLSRFHRLRKDLPIPKDNITLVTRTAKKTVVVSTPIDQGGLWCRQESPPMDQMPEGVWSAERDNVKFERTDALDLYQKAIDWPASLDAIEQTDNGDLYFKFVTDTGGTFNMRWWSPRSHKAWKISSVADINIGDVLVLKTEKPIIEISNERDIEHIALIDRALSKIKGKPPLTLTVIDEILRISGHQTEAEVSIPGLKAWQASVPKEDHYWTMYLNPGLFSKSWEALARLGRVRVDYAIYGFLMSVETETKSERVECFIPSMNRKKQMMMGSLFSRVMMEQWQELNADEISVEEAAQRMQDKN